MADELRSGRLEPGQSVLDAIECASGRKARVLLRDVPEEHAPMIRVPSPDSDEKAEDDRRYMILGEIARGGMGVVFKCRDKDLGREVAVKMLRKRFTERSDVMERFVEEAQITGQLHHPGVVPIYDVGLQPDGRPYFVMKLVKGRTLAAMIEERAAAPAERRQLLSEFEQICRALAYAHARGVIHRDLKPSNVMLGAFGEVQVVDWGFAKILGLQRDDESGAGELPDLSVIATVRSGEGSSQSIAGSVMGTPAYMPPEQALGQIDRLDERADVFSLGAILCEILTGKPPYVGDPSDLLILAAQAKLDDAYERLDACGAHAELVRLTRSCLQPLRGDRPAHAGEVADAVSAHLASVEERVRTAEVEAARERANQREEHARLEREAAAAAWERKARRRVLVIAATLLVAVLLGGGAYLLVQRDREAQAERTTVAVREAEDQARLLEGRAHWVGATAAAERAVRLAAQPEIDAGTRRRTETLLDRLRQRQSDAAAKNAQAQRDALLVDRLAEIQAQWLRGRERIPTAAAFAAAFAEHDLRLNESDAAKKIRSRPVATALVAALDDLEVLAPVKPPLRALIRDADPDPWRTRVRDLHDGDDADGLAKLADAPDLAAQPAASLLLLGRMLLAHDRAAAAEQVLLGAYHRFPSDSGVIVRLADACEAQQPPRWDQVTRYLTAALALRPASPALRNRLGRALAHAGDLDAAVATLQEGELQGLDMEGYCQLGRVLARKGDREGTINAFREAMRQAPKSARPHHGLGIALVQSFHDYEAAIAALQEALRLDPQSPSIHRDLGVAYDGNRDPTRALEALRTALRLRPDFIDGRESLGVVLAGQHRYREAIDEFMKVATDDPRRGSVWYHLGRAYLATGRYRGALANFESADNARDRSPHLNMYRGLAYERLGKKKEAVYWVGRAFLADKSDAEAQCHLGRVMFQRGDWKAGLSHSRQGHEKGRALGDRWHYPSTEQVARQERQFAIATRVDAGQPGGRASLDLAAVLFHRERWEKAGTVYTRLIPLPAGEARLRAVASALRAAQAEGLDEKGRMDRREVARAWMKRELKHWRPRAAKGDHDAFRTLMDWKEGWMLEPVHPKNLARLPEKERAAWQAFWREVDAALAESER